MKTTIFIRVILAVLLLMSLPALAQIDKVVTPKVIEEKPAPKATESEKNKMGDMQLLESIEVRIKQVPSPKGADDELSKMVERLKTPSNRKTFQNSFEEKVKKHNGDMNDLLKTVDKDFSKENVNKMRDALKTGNPNVQRLAWPLCLISGSCD